MAQAIVLTERDECRFREKVTLPDNNGCMLWCASRDTCGYGQFHLGGRVVKAHQVSWMLAYGEFPPGLEPDHTCEVRHCTTADHIEWVTHEENNHRIAARSETCMRGHRWDEQEPLAVGRKRECRICRNKGRRQRYQRARASGMSASEARTVA